MEWHINADEPPLFDYNLEHGRDPSLIDGDSPYRASDHDPVIVGLELVD
jgi:predicted extracellular nuclease